MLVDWSQNSPHKSTVCAYSLRPGPAPTVSTPITWRELEAARRKRDASGLVFGPAAVLKRIEKHGDLFAAVLTRRQAIPEHPPDSA